MASLAAISLPRGRPSVTQFGKRQYEPMWSDVRLHDWAISDVRGRQAARCTSLGRRMPTQCRRPPAHGAGFHQEACMRLERRRILCVMLAGRGTAR
jgi:hypothetical protein